MSKITLTRRGMNSVPRDASGRKNRDYYEHGDWAGLLSEVGYLIFGTRNTSVLTFESDNIPDVTDSLKIPEILIGCDLQLGIDATIKHGAQSATMQIKCLVKGANLNHVKLSKRDIDNYQRSGMFQYIMFVWPELGSYMVTETGLISETIGWNKSMGGDGYVTAYGLSIPTLALVSVAQMYDLFAVIADYDLDYK